MTRKNIMVLICLFATGSLYAQQNIFIFPIMNADLAQVAVDSFNTRVSRYFRKEADLEPEIINYSMVRVPESAEEIKRIIEDITVFDLSPDFTAKITEGGWIAGFLLENRNLYEKSGEYISELTISCVLVDLGTGEPLSPLKIVSAGASPEGEAEADMLAIRNFPDQLHEALLNGGFYDQGEFNYAMTGRIWIYENQDGKLDKGDDCLILPGGYGQVLDATRKYYKVWVSQKPALPQKGGVLKPYANSWVDVSGGASVFYNLFEGDYGIDASIKAQFRKKFLYFRPLVGVDLLLYEAADNPLLLSGGFAYSRLLGRLRLDFSFAVCIGQRFSPNNTVSHTGTKIAVHASIPLFSFLRLELEGGILALKGEASDTVNGVIAGAAFVIQ